MAAVSGFTVAWMLCGTATTLTEMVLFRLMQGAFGAALVPLSQAVLLDTFPRERHGSAMAMWGVGVMVGTILGPTLGGYLTELYNWRWVRSEEHTSELQSLMRNSYAVFGLKKTTSYKR